MGQKSENPEQFLTHCNVETQGHVKGEKTLISSCRLETWNLYRSTTVLYGFHVIKYLQLVLTVQTK